MRYLKIQQRTPKVEFLAIVYMTAKLYKDPLRVLLRKVMDHVLLKTERNDDLGDQVNLYIYFPENNKRIENTLA